jgi:hypothetical protein
MSNLLSDVISGMLATVAVVALSWLASRIVRVKVLVGIARLTGSGITAVFKSDVEGAKDIVAEVRRSSVVRIFSMRAFRLLKDDAPLAFLLREDCPIREVRVLLADPTSDAVQERAKEFVHIDASYTADRYISDIQWSAEQIAANQRNPHLALRIHREPAFVRLLITDNYLFLSYFLRNVHGDNSCVYKISCHSPLYEAMTRFFDWTWFHKSSVFSRGTL